MQIIDYNESMPSLDAESVVAVGNFDGVHKGHELLIKEVVSCSRKHHLAGVIMTFEPHTRTILFPDTVQPVLSTFEEKAELIESYGVDYLVRIPFDPAFAGLSADEFIDKILLGKFNARQWVMGDRHTFGKNHQGNKNYSHDGKGRNHINKVLIQSMNFKNGVISSTEIRAGILEGRIQDAVCMLGHPYLIISERISGLKKGTQIGYPTLNFTSLPSNKVLPPPGIYAAELSLRKNRRMGALYFGNCPTFGANRETHFEFHLFDYNGDEPEQGEKAGLWLHSMIRKDNVFSNSMELTSAIKEDIQTIQNYFLQEKEQCQ
jgi:riboflavin kinase / FMN adenylyltransferase